MMMMKRKVGSPHKPVKQACALVETRGAGSERASWTSAHAVARNISSALQSLAAAGGRLRGSANKEDVDSSTSKEPKYSNMGT